MNYKHNKSILRKSNLSFEFIIIFLLDKISQSYLCLIKQTNKQKTSEQNLTLASKKTNLQAPQPTISMPGTKSNKSYFEEDSTNAADNSKQQSNAKGDNQTKKANQKENGKQGNGQR